MIWSRPCASLRPNRNPKWRPLENKSLIIFGYSPLGCQRQNKAARRRCHAVLLHQLERIAHAHEAQVCAGYSSCEDDGARQPISWSVYRSACPIGLKHRGVRLNYEEFVLQKTPVTNRQCKCIIYWIYNLIRAVFFSKFERLFKKNMYNSIIQSIAHLKLWLFPNILAICGFHPKRTTPAWRPRMNQANFWYPVLMWTVFQWGRSASTGTNDSQKGQGLGYKAGGVKLPIHCFPNSS